MLVAAATLGVLLAACDGWPGGSGLRVEGATPYVRCLAAGPPPAGEKRVGKARITTREGAVRVDGLRAPVTIAAFAGAGFAGPPGPRELAALAKAQPQLVLVLGGLGDTDEIASATAAALASLPVPTLILAGGRDRPERIERALGALKGGVAARITDITGAATVRIGGDTFIPVAGAYEGRYALDDEACGYASSDLEAHGARGDSQDLPRSRRWLLAWEAPAGKGGPAAIARDAHGLDLGIPALAEFAERVGAAGGLFAWPHVQVLRPSVGAGRRHALLGVAEPDLQLVVPRISGPAIERSDGSRIPAGFALLRLERKGMALVAAHAVP